MQAEFRKLPGVDKLLNTEQLATLIQIHSRTLVTEAIRVELDAARQKIDAGQPAQTFETLLEAVKYRVSSSVEPSLQPVINATGVIIHTNLGRALLSHRAKAAMLQAATTYSNLEYDLEAGRRGSRYVHAADLLCRLTGAESAVVVNNNAGAVVLALSTLAREREVVISRGQLVEIGGGFRIPDIMTQSGCKLVEVGATNRSYTNDYEQAITGNTGLILTVHASNYKIIGFTAQPTLAEMAALAHRHQLPLMEDLGSGTLLDTAPFGLVHEPTIQESIAAGVDVVTASGDKLLGGPQVGIILGRKDIIDCIKTQPLIRALRVDKTTLAALQATLLAYLEDKAVEEIPVWRMIATPPPILGRRSRRWLTALKKESVSKGILLQVVNTVSTVGGGSLPDQTLPTRALAISVDKVDTLAEQLRLGNQHPPIITRIENDKLILDPRTVLPEQDKTLISALKSTLQSLPAVK
jgi:L-seryl-tRNA(Ser) seleniumtransferase